MVFFLKLIPDGKQTPLSPDLSGYAPAHPAWYCGTLAELLSLLAAGRLKPAVAERVPLLEAAQVTSRWNAVEMLAT